MLDDNNDEVTSLAYSPVGSTLASASLDHTIRVWNAHTWLQIGILPCPGSIESCVINVQGTRIAIKVLNGNLHLLELVDKETNPIIVTAQKHNQKLIVRCPACQKEHPLSQEQLGKEMTCPLQAAVYG